uniref:Uncharacterized protein n=1 Tax=Rhizophora mucronata TaxID=61149 RepID=A0A2P2M7L9_RHIMU
MSFSITTVRRRTKSYQTRRTLHKRNFS